MTNMIKVTPNRTGIISGTGLYRLFTSSEFISALAKAGNIVKETLHESGFVVERDKSGFYT